MNDRVSVLRLDSASTGKDQLRFDRAPLLPGSRRMEDGSLLAPAFVAKPGILVYQHLDGTTTRELVPEEELFNPESLATLGRVALTLEHPEEGFVSPENVARLGVGDVGEKVLIDDGYVRVVLCARRADAIQAIERGKQEVSPGYRCFIDPTPGVHAVYGPYDAVQRNRRYNHVAVTERARGGPDIRLRADSAVQVEPLPSPSPRHSMTPTMIALLARLGVKVRKDAEEAMVDEAGVKVDELLGKATELGGAQAKVAELEAALKKAREELAAATPPAGEDSAPADPAAVVEDAMEEDPKVCAADAKPEEKAAAEKTDSLRKAVVAHAQARGRLEHMALGLGVDPAEIAKMGNRRLRKAIVAKANPSARADASDDYYRAMVDMLPGPTARTDAADPDGNPYAVLAQAFSGNTRSERTDAAKKPALSPEEEYRANIERQRQKRLGIDA